MTTPEKGTIDTASGDVKNDEQSGNVAKKAPKKNHIEESWPKDDERLLPDPRSIEVEDG